MAIVKRAPEPRRRTTFAVDRARAALVHPFLAPAASVAVAAPTPTPNVKYDSHRDYTVDKRAAELASERSSVTAHALGIAGVSQTTFERRLRAASVDVSRANTQHTCQRNEARAKDVAYVDWQEETTREVRKIAGAAHSAHEEDSLDERQRKRLIATTAKATRRRKIENRRKHRPRTPPPPSYMDLDEARAVAEAAAATDPSVADEQHTVTHFMKHAPRNNSTIVDEEEEEAAAAASGDSSDELNDDDDASAVDDASMRRIYRKAREYPYADQQLERVASEVRAQMSDPSRVSNPATVALSRHLLGPDKALFLTSLLCQSRTNLMPANMLALDDAGRISAVCVQRSVEERALREPYGRERACVYGADCEGRFIPGTRPITLKEFIPPDVLAHAKLNALTGKIETAQHYPCVMCIRKLVATMFIECRSLNRPVSSKTLLSRTFNLVNVAGEYSPYNCICNAAYGLPYPVVCHQRSYYEQVAFAGDVLGFAQTGYERMGEAPSSF